MRCKAAVLEGPDRPFKLEVVELSDLPDHCVLIKNRASGICGGDLHRFEGTSVHEFPIILGHEATGVIERVGRAVQGFEEGERVVVSDARPCLACSSCLREPPRPCERADKIFLTHPAKRVDGQPIRAFHSIGSLSEYVIAASSSVIKLPDQIPWPVAALIACGGQTGLGSVFNIAKLSPASSIAVFGCGSVGLCVVMAAKLFNARPIIAVDIRPERLELARRVGADLFINSSEADPVKRIVESTNNGCDFAFECLGSVPVYKQAFNVLSEGGTLVAIGAPPEQNKEFPVDVYSLLGARRILGSNAGGTKPQRDYPIWFDLYLKGKLPLDQLLTKSYQLDDVLKAFHEMAKGVVAKPIIKF